jgi:hypothetical protein
VVVDWDAALVIDEPHNLDETLYLMELANVQLAELEAYDHMLDEAVERSYRDISARRFRAGRRPACSASCARSASTWRASATSCRTSPSSSATGTWRASTRAVEPLPPLRLAPHDRRKLKTLDDLYQLLRAEQNNRWMLILETSIVLLFVIDLIILGMGIKRG